VASINHLIKKNLQLRVSWMEVRQWPSKVSKDSW